MSYQIKVLIFFSVIATFLIPTNILAESDGGWDSETIIDVSIVGDSIINLDSTNTLLRVYVDITNFDPSDGYYFLRIIQSATNNIISEDNIIIREKSNGKAGADVAHLVTEGELGTTADMLGNYDVIVFTENGGVTGNTTFTVIKPSEPINLSTEFLEYNETSTELSEENDQSSETELINAKKIPDWVKNIFVLYSYDEISEDELINALTFLIDQGIIEINN
ncbi:MAG: hypothetical protein JRZ95_05620 [Nitrososphaerota archaeon]|nr:hypothetical protein [Nitrososphaerota archaeon]